MGQIKAREASLEEEGQALAERIVTLRKERKLTLQECAKLSGVAASTLSKIERRDLSPTISTLHKIATGFSMELTDLLNSNRPVFSPGRRSISRKGEGRPHTSYSCENALLCGELKDKQMIPIRTMVTARHPDDYGVWPKSETEIFLFVVSGKMVVHSKVYEPLELSAGDAVYYDASSEHCWTSASEQDAEVIWVMSA